MGTQRPICWAFVGVVAALTVACSSSADPGGPAFDGAAAEVACASDIEATHCFEVTIVNIGQGAGDGRCWVVAILDFRTELARSEPIMLRDVGTDERVTGTVALRQPGDGGDVGYPVHCDPAPHG